MRLYYIDFLRIISAFGVVLLHSSGAGLLTYNGEAFDRFLLLNSFTRLAVPIFFMCSGAVILDRDYRFEDVYKRIKRILLPLVFWGVFYELYLIRAGVQKDLYTIIMDLLCDKAMYHLWFLYSLLGVIVITPVLFGAVSKMEDKEWRWCAILVLGLSAIKTILVYLNLYPAVSFTTIPMSVVYFVFGYYLMKKSMTLSNKVLSLVGICSVFVVALLTRGGSEKTGAFSEAFIGMDCLFVIIGSVAVFLLAKQIGDFSSIHIRNALVKLNGATLFCYIIHVLILDNLYRRLFQYDFYTSSYPVLSSFLLAVLTFTISILVGIILKKIKLFRYFV